MPRVITLPQIGAIVLGQGAGWTPLSSGHVLLWGRQLRNSHLLDLDRGTAGPLTGLVAAVHVGAGLTAGFHRREVELWRAGVAPVTIGLRGTPAGCRFSSNGVWLWALTRRRRWTLRAYPTGTGKPSAELVLPDPDPAAGAWTLAREHPIINAIVVKSVDRHIAVELAADGSLESWPLALDVLVDWMPDGRALLGGHFDGRLTVQRWHSDEPIRAVATTRLAELVLDQLGLHGAVLDDERALLDTLGGRLFLADLGDPGAEHIEIRLAGDDRPLGLAVLALGRSGRLLTGRTGDDLLRLWDATEVLRTIPTRGLR